MSDSESIGSSGQEDEDGMPTSSVTPITMVELLENFDSQKLSFFGSKQKMIEYKIGVYSKRLEGLDKLIKDKDKLIDLWSKTLEDRGYLTPDNSFQLLNERVPEWITYQSQMINYSALLDALKKQQKEFKANWRAQFAELEKSLSSFQKNYLGRESVQDKIAQILYAFFENWQYAKTDFLNFLYLGDPGTGKTQLASYVAKILSLSGILAKDNVIVVGKQDFVGQYLGTTAPRTLSLLEGSLESVLFLDEAYNLTTRDQKGDFDPYSLEAITTIVGFLDKNRGSISFQAAGYVKQMIENFLGSNPGMTRRFPYVFSLTNFTAPELTDIFVKLLSGQYGIDAKIVSNEALDYLESLIQIGGKALFPFQAGSMENFASIVARRISSFGLKGEGLFGPCSMRDAYREYVASFFIGQAQPRQIDVPGATSDAQCSDEFSLFPPKFDGKKAAKDK